MPLSVPDGAPEVIANVMNLCFTQILHIPFLHGVSGMGVKGKEMLNAGRIFHFFFQKPDDRPTFLMLFKMYCKNEKPPIGDDEE